MIGFYLLSIFAMTLGAALVLDFKGFRRFFTRRPGESEEYARKFQTPAILAGLIFSFFRWRPSFDPSLSEVKAVSRSTGRAVEAGSSYLRLSRVMDRAVGRSGGAGFKRL